MKLFSSSDCHGGGTVNLTDIQIRTPHSQSVGAPLRQHVRLHQSWKLLCQCPHLSIPILLEFDKLTDKLTRQTNCWCLGICFSKFSVSAVRNGSITCRRLNKFRTVKMSFSPHYSKTFLILSVLETLPHIILEICRDLFLQRLQTSIRLEPCLQAVFDHIALFQLCQ